MFTYLLRRRFESRHTVETESLGADEGCQASDSCRQSTGTTTRFGVVPGVVHQLRGIRWGLMALPIRAALRSAGRYVTRNPFTVMKMAWHVVGLRVAVPLDALRWFIANTPPSKRVPTDITILADPPAITLGATVDLMGTKVRASATVRVDELRIGPNEVRLALRLSKVDLKLIGDANTPVATLIKSGALDLSKPGNLVNYMPKKPDVLIEAHDDQVVLDLMKNPTLSTNQRLRQILSTLTPVVNVSALKTEDDFLILGLRATPMGFAQAFQAVRALHP